MVTCIVSSLILRPVEDKIFSEKHFHYLESIYNNKNVICAQDSSFAAYN